MSEYGSNNPRVFIRSILVWVVGVVAVLGHWWFKDFRLRILGDGLASVNKCANLALLSAPLESVTSVRLLRALFQMPFCAVVDVAGVRAWLVVQIVLWGVACALIYRTGALLFNEPAGIFSGFAIATLWETFRFAVRPQSDLILLVAVALSLWTMARYLQTPTTRREIAVVVALLLVTTARPLGLPLVFGWTVWLVLRRAESDEWYPQFSKTGWVLLGITIGIIVLILPSFVLPRLVLAHTDPTLTWRRSFVAAWANGIVVTHTTIPTFEYQYTPRAASTMLGWLLLNADHLLVIALFKSTFFFVPVLSRWSTFHIVVNLMTLFPLTIGTFIGTYRFIERRHMDLLGLLVTPVLMSVLTVWVFYLDGGFNYRAPATMVFPLITVSLLDQYLDLNRVYEIIDGYVPV